MRTIMVGRPDGLRARLRRETGWFRWLDETRREVELDPPEHDPVRVAALGIQEDEPEDGWVRVLDAGDAVPGSLTEVFVGGRAVVIANVQGELFAVESVCPHAGGPLADGELDGPTLTCPWHGWSYDVRSGTSLTNESVTLETFPVRVEGGAILVEV